MMPSLGQFAGLAIACSLLIAVPGPSVVFVVGRALSYGRRTALASVAGNCAGCYLVAACVALGIGPLMQRSELVLQGIKLAGAAYLVWLGIQAVRHAAPIAVQDNIAAGAPTTAQAVRSGILVGVSNPKGFLVFAAILPQFVTPATGHVTIQMLLLAVVPVAVGLVTDSAWALTAARARNWLSRTPLRTRTVGRAGGVSMIGLGVSVALTGQRD